METKKNGNEEVRTGSDGGGENASQHSPSRSHLFTSENRPPGGRPKGVPNKLTKTFKAAAEEAFSTYEDPKKNIQNGVQWLQSMMSGTASDRAAVLQLFGRLIPAQLQGEVNHSVKVQLTFAQGRNVAPNLPSDTQSAGGRQIPHANQDVIDIEPNPAVPRCAEGVESPTQAPSSHDSNANETRSHLEGKK